MPTFTESYLNYDGTVISTSEVEYKPKGFVSRLDHFHLAECARQRMTENALDMNRWRGERRSFYNAIRMMEVDEVTFMD